MSELTIVDLFKAFFNDFKDDNNTHIYNELIKEMEIKNSRSLNVNFAHLMEFSAELAANLLRNPESYIEAAGIALKDQIQIYNADYANMYRRFNVRFYNLPDVNRIALRHIRGTHVNKLLQVSGIITEMTTIKQKLVFATFTCNSCLANVTIEQPDIEIIYPNGCSACERHRVRFTINQSLSEFIDYQKVVIQERPEDLPSGELPRYIECYTYDDLLDVVKPGQRINITGILKSKQQGNTTVFYNYININHIESLQDNVDEIVITADDEAEIKKLAQDPELFNKLIDAIGPNIYGLTEIKEAILLALFGGTFHRHQDPALRRGEIHVLIIGDPGLGKSQLLRSVMNIAPIAIYSTGKGSSAAGLTCAIVPEKNSSHLTIHAGVFVLADKGMAIIDEFEKMNERDMNAIHETLEQLTVSISKAGFHLTLNSRTTLIAACNPAAGRYNPYLSPAENIKTLKPTILNRFDLIFILRDVPTEKEDKKLASFVLKENTKVSSLNRDLIKKYIFYARKNIKPKLTDEAKQLLEDFYIKVRGLGYHPDPDYYKNPIPITPRYLEALIRLSEANAKYHLRSTVSIDDANAAIRLLSYSLGQVGIDQETGLIDIDIIETGRALNRRRAINKILDTIKELTETNGEPPTFEQLYEELTNVYNDEKNLQRDLDMLIKDGHVYSPRSNIYKLTS